MIGLIKNSIKVPFISLQDFVDNSKYEAAKEELLSKESLIMELIGQMMLFKQNKYKHFLKP